MASKLQLYNMNGDLAMILPMVPIEDADVIDFYANDLYTYMDEVFSNLVSGNWSTDKLNDYIKMMNDLGLEEIRAVYQKLYDTLPH